MELEIENLRVYVLEEIPAPPWGPRSYGFNVFNSWSSAYECVCQRMWVDGTEPAPLEPGEYKINALDSKAHPDQYEIYERHVQSYVFNESEQKKLAPVRRRRRARLEREEVQ